MGKIELDHTGSGSGVTLSSDGTDLLLDGTAIGGGGGGADLYAAETTGSTDPTATGTLSLAIGSSANGSGTNAVAIGNGAAAGTYSVGIGWNAGNTGSNNTIIGRTGSTAGTSGATVIGYNADVSDYSSNQTALGYQAKTSSGAQATALTQSYASGANSFAAAIANNTSSYGATGANSVALSQNAKASSSETIALGPYTQATANAAVSIGAFSDATAQRGFALGNYAKAGSIGKFAFSNQRYAAVGDTQGGLYVLRQQTSNATPIALTTSSGGTPTSTQIILPSGSAYAFTGTIVAKQLSSSNAAAWEVKGLIVNQGGTTTLTNSAITVISNTPSWGMALSADDTNDALAITVTGAASTIIRWVANIQTSEVSIA